MKKILAGAVALSALAWASSAHAADDAAADAGADGSADIIVTATRTTYATSDVTPVMIERVAPIASVNTAINELPGVLVTEADAFGSADWATNITIRGFSTNDGHIGTTIDGMPNGGSGYGGGSKANRYLDVQNLKTISVSQGTADISSRTNESLGGTLDYQTTNPEQDRRYRFTVAGGDFGGRKLYARIDTGEIAPGTYAWISASTSRVKDWVAQSDTTSRDHLAAKLTSDLGKVDLTGYVSFDDANEGEYGSVSLANFRQNPDFDGLTANWTGTPYLDQNFRSGSRALRKNLFGYLRAKADLGEVKLVASAYGHTMRGRGDWLPPYLVDVTDDGAGNPNSEFDRSGTVYGGSPLGKIYYALPNGATAPLNASCTGSAGIPAEYDPSCYPTDAAPVMSYRHTHYKNRRLGAVLDANWEHDFGSVQNLLRAGVWYENGKSNVVRDWHKVTDARSSYQFDHVPYYAQYDRDYGVNEFVYYVDNSVTLGDLTVRGGLKQYHLDQDRNGVVGDALSTRMKYHSDVLFSAGLNYRPTRELEVFAGYSQNFAALGRSLLDEDESVRREIRPETADSIEAGLRYTSNRVNASITVYDIKFDNRVVFVPSNFVTGIDYLSEVDGVYLNVGGVKSRGVEAALAYRITPQLSVSTSYSYNRAKYLGTGDAARDEALEIVPGAQVFNTPKSMWVGSVDYSGDLFRAGVSTKYVSSRFIDRQGKDPSGSFWLTNAYVGVNVGEIAPALKGMDFAVTVNNLTNKRYLAGADGGSAFLGAPRTVMAALTLDF